MFAIQSIIGTWTNEAGRNALGATAYSPIVVTNLNDKSKSTELEVHPAPKSAVNVLKAAFNLCGGYGLAMDEAILARIGVKPGQLVDVKLVQPRIESNREGTSAHAGSLKSRMEQTLIGEGDELSGLTESQVSSGAYATAKKLGFKVKKVNLNTIRRIN